MSVWDDWFDDHEKRSPLSEAEIEFGWKSVFEPPSAAHVEAAVEAGCEEDDVHAAVLPKAVAVPPHYRALLLAGNGGTARTGERRFHFFRLAQVREALWRHALPLRATGYIPIGQDDDGNLYSFLFVDGLSEEAAAVCLIRLDSDEVAPIADDLAGACAANTAAVDACEDRWMILDEY